MHKLYEYKYIHVNTCTYFKNIYCICVWFYIDYGWHGMRTEPYGSRGKFQMEVIIPIPLEWIGHVCAIISWFEMHLTKGSI